MNNPDSSTILLATSNQGKVRELESHLPRSLTLLSLSDFDVQMPEETGSTFAENALLKASAAANQTGLLALADDSGLEVEALAGRPGVRSARYAGHDATAATNNQVLLAEMKGVANRGARFRAVLVLAHPDGRHWQFDGMCTGTIAFSERGTNGFGYDPLFVLPDGRTMAELDVVEKHQISHRGVAIRKLIAAIQTGDTPIRLP